VTGVPVPTEDVDFTEHVRPGDVVTWSQGAGEPVELVEQLLEQRHHIGPFTILLGASYTSLVRPEHADVCSFLAFGAVGSNRGLAASGRLDIIPTHLSDISRLLTRGELRVDVALVQVSGERGRWSAGAVNGYIVDALPRARAVIAESNSNAPWTTSVEPFPDVEFAAVVTSDRPLVELEPAQSQAVDRAIARNIVDLIPDGSTLQLGIGAVPNAVAQLMKGHRQLGLHSGVVGDAVVDLIKAGAMDHSRKTIDPGVGVTGGLIGTKALYEFADGNPLLRVDPVRYTHAQHVLSRIEGFVAVNSALEVDLTGQVGSEVAGTRYVGTVGGQVDFIRGALASMGGRSIIGLPARTARGCPRIVPLITSGVVTVPRSDADVVVTEYGVAHLRGRPLAQRMVAMARIAHPDDREHLEREAARLLSA
jgi:acyl-CoA hydrolase